MSRISRALPEAGCFSDVPDKPLAEDEFFATLLIRAIKEDPLHRCTFEQWVPQGEAGWSLQICNGCGLFRIYDRSSSQYFYDRWLSEQLVSKLKCMEEIAVRWHLVGYDILAFYLSEGVVNFTVYPIGKLKKNTKMVHHYFGYKKVKNDKKGLFCWRKKE